jgi:hypothetical protein
MANKYHTHSGRLAEWRRTFAEAARMCSEKVKGLPKGQKLQAYRMCMRETLRKK